MRWLLRPGLSWHPYQTGRNPQQGAAFVACARGTICLPAVPDKKGQDIGDELATASRSAMAKSIIRASVQLFQRGDPSAGGGCQHGFLEPRLSADPIRDRR